MASLVSDTQAKVKVNIKELGAHPWIHLAKGWFSFSVKTLQKTRLVLFVADRRNSNDPKVSKESNATSKNSFPMVAALKRRQFNPMNFRQGKGNPERGQGVQDTLLDMYKNWLQKDLEDQVTKSARCCTTGAFSFFCHVFMVSMKVCSFFLLSCPRVCLLDVNRPLGQILCQSAPVCCFMQEAVRVFFFSVFSIGSARYDMFPMVSGTYVKCLSSSNAEI